MQLDLQFPLKKYLSVRSHNKLSKLVFLASE